jgi:hypothetical protein
VTPKVPDRAYRLTHDGLGKKVMPDVLIAAIARTANQADLEKMLSQCIGLETTQMTLLRKDRLNEAAARLRTHFLPSRAIPVASGTHGTNVPGMGTTLTLTPYFADATVNYLKGLGISHEAANYYNIAIAEGYSVVTYVTGTGDADSVEKQFRACGFVKIRRISLTEEIIAMLPAI